MLYYKMVRSKRARRRTNRNVRRRTNRKVRRRTKSKVRRRTNRKVRRRTKNISGGSGWASGSPTLMRGPNALSSSFNDVETPSVRASRARTEVEHCRQLATELKKAVLALEAGSGSGSGSGSGYGSGSGSGYGSRGDRGREPEPQPYSHYSGQWDGAGQYTRA